MALLLGLTLAGSTAWAQPYQYLLHIKDKDGIPGVRDTDKDGILELTFSTPALQQLYVQGNYKVTAFRRNFTAISTGTVANVYYVEVDDDTFLSRLEREKPNWYDYAAPPTITFDGTQSNTYIPDDFHIIPGYTPTNLRMIRAPEAWHITKGDPGVVIGFADGDLNETHEDLKKEIDYSVDNNPVDGDHGTGVVGLAAAETDNITGISGVGFNCHIGFTSTHEGNGQFSMQVWDRMMDMARDGIEIINCSWSLYDEDDPDFGTYDPIVRAYLDTLQSMDVLLIFSAGNDPDASGSLKAYRYPGAYSNDYDNVMCVTSVGHIRSVGAANGENWKDAAEEWIGDPMTTHRRHDRVDICAPGFSVGTTGFSPTQPCAGSGCDAAYMIASGSSFAAAHVSGAAGMLLSVNSSLTSAEMKRILKSTADAAIYTMTYGGALVNGDYLGQLGTGRLDMYQAVKTAQDLRTTYVSDTILCPTGQVEVGFQSDVSLYAPPNPLGGFNTITAQLSDASGSFINPVNIGSVQMDPNQYTPLIATIPPGTPPSTDYRIRVVSSNPELIGVPYEYSITVQTTAPGATLSTAIDISVLACSGVPVVHQINTALGCFNNDNGVYQDEAYYRVSTPTTGTLTITSCGQPSFQTAIKEFPSGPSFTGNCAVLSSGSTPLQAGTYMFTVEGTGQNGLIETEFFFSPSPNNCRGSGGASAPQAMVLFPNPARTHFELSEATEGAVRLFDLTGRLVRTYPAGTTSYDVRTLPAGSYLVEIDQDAGILRRRLQLTR